MKKELQTKVCNSLIFSVGTAPVPVYTGKDSNLRLMWYRSDFDQLCSQTLLRHHR